MEDMPLRAVSSDRIRSAEQTDFKLAHYYRFKMSRILVAPYAKPIAIVGAGQPAHFASILDTDIFLILRRWIAKLPHLSTAFRCLIVICYQNEALNKFV